ncbi:hypothetical protein C8R46DRAFT_1093899 [Mycena filopes]|nr:hypothetical protein C8R46DRAFT_1093899 [Mycena filopes]
MSPKGDAGKDAAKPKVIVSAPSVSPNRKDKKGPSKSPSPSPPRPKVAKEPLVPPKAKDRPVTPDLTPKRSVPQRRRTNSLQAKEKPKALTTDAPSKPSKVPQTILERLVKIPWSETYRRGFGINALTGEFIPRSALQDGAFKMNDSSVPGESTITTDRLEWRGVEDLQNGFEIEAGGTVNVLPIGANAKFASILSKNTSKSTILVQYKVEAGFAPDYIPPENVKLKAGLSKLSGDEFRAQFGDYYIAGYQKAYSCRMIVVCKINEDTVTKSLEREVKATVENYFKGGIKVFDIEKQSKSFSLLSVIVDADGCSTDANSVFSATVTVADAPRTLKNVLKRTPGVPRVAYLYRYSDVESCKLSPKLDVPKDMFEKARDMRSLYAFVQAALLHPALQEFHWDRRTSNAVLKRFEDQQKSLVRKDNKKAKEIDALHGELARKRNKANALILRYELIRLVVEMDKGITAHPPKPVKGLQLYRWECGKAGAPKKITELKAYNLVTFGPYKAFELEWQSPLTDFSAAFPQWLGGSKPRATMTFTTRESDDSLPPLPRPPTPPSSLFRARVPAPRPDGAKGRETFEFCLADHQPVYVLGWEVVCYWDGKSEPTIEVDHHSNYIFSDRLSISVDGSRSTQWTVKVTFVVQSSYKFPDLMSLLT